MQEKPRTEFPVEVFRLGDDSVDDYTDEDEEVGEDGKSWRR